jgi:hypothetical protein
MKLGFSKLKATAAIGNKLAYVACLTDPNSQPGLDVSAIVIPLSVLT